MVFCFGLLIGAVAMWFAVYPFFHRVTLVESRSNVVPRPSFLMHSLPENRRSQRSEAPQPRNTFAAPATTVGSSSAVASDAAAGSSSAVASDAAAGSPSAVASAAAGSSSAATGSTSAVANGHAASERGSRTSNTRRRNMPRIPEIPLYVSPMGQKYHGDPNYKGLRNARSIQQCARCPDCFPHQTRPNVNVYGLGSGSTLHGDPSHVAPGEVKEYGPCAVCMYG